MIVANLSLVTLRFSNTKNDATNTSSHTTITTQPCQVDGYQPYPYCLAENQGFFISYQSKTVFQKNASGYINILSLTTLYNKTFFEHLSDLMERDNWRRRHDYGNRSSRSISTYKLSSSKLQVQRKRVQSTVPRQDWSATRMYRQASHWCV
jgi:hypothetical protein